MAFGFIKKVFSFGKKKVEEIPAEGAGPAKEPEAPGENAAGMGAAEPAREALPSGPLPPVKPAPPEVPKRTEPEAAPAPEPAAESKPAEPRPPDRKGHSQDARAKRPDDHAAIGRVASKAAEETALPIAEVAPAAETPEAVSTATEPAKAKAGSKEAGREGEQADAAKEKDKLALTGKTEPESGAKPVEAQAENRSTAEAAEKLPLAPEPEIAGPEEVQAGEASGPEPADETGEATAGKSVSEPNRSKKNVEIAAPVPRKVQVAAKVAETARPEPEPAAEPALRPSWFKRLRSGLSRSSRELSENISGVFTKRKLDEDTLQDLEDVLIQADLGLETAIRITDALSEGRYGKDISDGEVRGVMAGEIEKVLGPVALPLELDLSYKPHVILVVGVNGTGKTTTIGKLAAKLAEGGLSVMLAAGDTFRAAAIEQLKIWGERVGAPVVSSRLGADAAGLAYDAFEKAREAGCDVLIIDTAGRLQNKAELMDELAKIVRVLGKLDPEAPHTVLQTLDATTGQNALNQVEIFRNVAGVNGLVMTKLDGTARGGILVAIAAKHKLPVYFVGVGEQVDDLEPFSAREFAAAITGVEHEPANL